MYQVRSQSKQTVELGISRAIQECQICKHMDMTFAYRHGKKYKTAFNMDVLVRQEQVINDSYYTVIFSFECLHTGYTIARYENGNKYKSRYEMLNHVVTEYWTYGEHWEGFGMPRNAFFTAEPTDGIQCLCQAGRSDNIRWGWSELKLGNFKFLDVLDCTDISETTDLQFKLSERIFLHTSTISSRYQLRDTRYISNTKQPRFTFRPELKENNSRYPPRPGTRAGGPHNIGGATFPTNQVI